MSVLEARQSLSSAATAEDVAPLLSSATRILMVIGRNEPSLAAIRGRKRPRVNRPSKGGADQFNARPGDKRKRDQPGEKRRKSRPV